MTQRYAHLRNESLLRASNVLGNMTKGRDEEEREEKAETENQSK